MRRRHGRVRARDRNPRLGAAYDLLNRRRVGFFNDRLTHGGRSLKPFWQLPRTLERQLRQLADRVWITRTGETRFHFFLPR